MGLRILLEGFIRYLWRVWGPRIFWGLELLWFRLQASLGSSRKPFFLFRRLLA